MFIILGNKNNNTDSHIDWDEVLRGDANTDSKLHHSSFPLQVDLASIIAEKVTSFPGSPSGVVHRHIPFQVAPPNMSAILWCASPAATVSDSYHIYWSTLHTFSKNKKNWDVQFVMRLATLLRPSAILTLISFSSFHIPTHQATCSFSVQMDVGL
jgi:hypothetical protein